MASYAKLSQELIFKDSGDRNHLSDSHQLPASAVGQQQTLHSHPEHTHTHTPSHPHSQPFWGFFFTLTKVFFPLFLGLDGQIDGLFLLWVNELETTKCVVGCIRIISNVISKVCC